MRTKTTHVPILAAALLLALAAVPVFAGEEAPPEAVTAPAAVTLEAPVPAGCGAALDLARLAAPTTAVSPVPSAETGAPDFLALAGRTCRCSCGFPCKKDADCGPGGLCTGGITCC